MSRSEPELRFFTQLLPLFVTFFCFLLTLLGLKYQSSRATLFPEHGAIVLLIIIDVFTCTVALAVMTQSTSNTSYRMFFKSVRSISGDFAYDLLFLILFPPFGCGSSLLQVYLFLYVYFMPLTNKFSKCCQEILQSISHYTSNACHILCNWFKYNFPFQSI